MAAPAMGMNLRMAARSAVGNPGSVLAPQRGARLANPNVHCWVGRSPSHRGRWMG
jgi:hypothetical protein